MIRDGDFLRWYDQTDPCGECLREDDGTIEREAIVFDGPDGLIVDTDYTNPENIESLTRLNVKFTAQP